MTLLQSAPARPGLEEKVGAELIDSVKKEISAATLNITVSAMIALVGGMIKLVNCTSVSILLFLISFCSFDEYIIFGKSSSITLKVRKFRSGCRKKTRFVED